MRTCIVCGCTDEMACDGGCAWNQVLGETRGICSQCPEPLAHRKLTFAERERRRVLRRDVRSLSRERRKLTERLMEIECDFDVTSEASRDFEISLREAKS